MSRGLWFAAGAGAGIYAMVRGRRAAEVLTYDGLHDRLGALALGARMFRDEVAQGRAEAEAQVRERFAAPSNVISTRSTPELERGTP